MNRSVIAERQPSTRFSDLQNYTQELVLFARYRASKHLQIGHECMHLITIVELDFSVADYASEIRKYVPNY